MKFLAYIAAAGHALIAAAEHLETTPAGQTVVGDVSTVETDAKKTLSDAAAAAIGAVQQGATQEAVKGVSAALTKLGVPSEAAELISQYGVSAGEPFLTRLVALA